LAEKIRLQIKQLAFSEHPDLVVSATFGISLVEPGDTFATAFARADAAMYSGKNSGRDCCVLATS
jgi:PleD family two-component response regulator